MYRTKHRAWAQDKKKEIQDVKLTLQVTYLMLFMSSKESGTGGGWYVLAAAVETYITDVQCHVDNDTDSIVV